MVHRDAETAADGSPARRGRPRPRPRFELSIPLPPEIVLDRVRDRLAANPAVHGLVLDSGRIELVPPDDQVRIWSPQLTVDVTAAERGSRLRARVGPHPHVWTLYVLLYAVSLLFAIGCTMYGISQWVLGREPWVLYLTPVSAIGVALVYGAAYVGQGLGAEQTYALRRFLEDALGDAPGRVLSDRGGASDPG